MPRKQNVALVETRRNRVFELLVEGMSQRAIADKMGISKAQVCRDRDARLKELAAAHPHTEQYRYLQAWRLERAISAVYPLAISNPPDLKAVDRLTRLFERQARLLGLDMAVDVSHKTQVVDMIWRFNADDTGDAIEEIRLEA